MARYIALLRGVNVGGNVLKMARLRVLCDQLGLKNVETYVQSGNVVFSATGSASKIASAIEQKLHLETRLPVSVILRSASQLQQVLDRNPFLKQKDVDRSKLHVTFLATSARPDALKKLSLVQAGADQFHTLGKEIYLYCPGGYGRTKLSNTAIERVLGLRATTRNWNTVGTLCEMAGN